MSLYNEASHILISHPSLTLISLKTLLFHPQPNTSQARTPKSPPKQLYALLSETLKWNTVLKEVTERSGILQQERKLNPPLALLLLHDFLLSKKGLALKKDHPVRQILERHRTRLQAELTRIRVRRRCASLDALREVVEQEYHASTSAPFLSAGSATNGSNGASSALALSTDALPLSRPPVRFPHPRWLRINTLTTSLSAQISPSGSLAGYVPASSLLNVLSTFPTAKCYFLDPHVPDLIALPPEAPIAKLNGYALGELIPQDKASCFPAYLLDPSSLNGGQNKEEWEGHVLDACAAPGNKTTHLAALLQLATNTSKPNSDLEAGREKGSEGKRLGGKVLAVERDKGRAETLSTMVKRAGCKNPVDVYAGVDFLSLKVEEEPWCEVGAVLLDPSCSGSGIVGRDEGLDGGEEVKGGRRWEMPSTKRGMGERGNGRKRKRRRQGEERRVEESEKKNSIETVRSLPKLEKEEEDTVPGVGEDVLALDKRLDALSALQTKMLTHAFRFPNARRVTYSTCSIYDKENESVVIAALNSDVARERGWRILKREEQVEGMRAWKIRGKVEACESGEGAEEIAEGCIRCEKFTEEGTQGFFVAGFVREGRQHIDGADRESEDEWEGFGE